ncbi:MAG: hypothetical protein ABSD74_20495 [Rhizomicrobium sp.]|jgi:hypothetical protein
MPLAIKSSEIGLRKGNLLCGMSTKDRLAFIAEGLPIIFDSAASLVRASQTLIDSPREAAILEGHAEEESAKLLILIDIVRCPTRRAASRIGPMMRWFYDHLARLIYARAQYWRPSTAAELQSYIDNERRSHYLEGEFGEYIMPNWALFQRESALYADVAGDEDREPQWLSPIRSSPLLPSLVPAAFRVADALSAVGALTLGGVKILSEVWGATPVLPETGWEITRDNYQPLVERLDAAGLITDRASQDHVNLLADTWQMPMYEMDFAQIQVPLEDLMSEREAQYPYW